MQSRAHKEEQKENRRNYRNYERAKQNIDTDILVNWNYVDTRWQQYITVHIYTQMIHRTTQLTTLVRRLSGIRTQIGQTKFNDELTE